MELEDMVSILEVGESTDKLRHRHTHSTGVCRVLTDRQTDRQRAGESWVDKKAIREEPALTPLAHPLLSILTQSC